MNKWLLVSALAMNLLAFFWFTGQGEASLNQDASTDRSQNELTGEIILLSELEIIPPARPPSVAGKMVVEDPLSKGADVIAVDSIQPLLAPAGDSLRATVDGNPKFVASQQVGHSGNLKKGALAEKGLPEQKPMFEAQFEPEPEPEPEPEQQCLSLGRFDKEQDAIGLLEQLKDAVGVAARINTVAEGLVRYLVYMPPFDTRVMAKERQLELKEAGIRSSLYYKGDLKDGLSLGYFGSRANAERRYKSLLAADYRVELKSVETRVVRYWVELQARDDSRLSRNFWRDMAETFPNVVRKEVECSVVE